MSLTARSNRTENDKVLHEIRMGEINKDLPKMNTLDLMSMKQEMLERVNNFKASDFGSNSPQEARDALRAVNSELDKRIQDHKVANGTDDATMTANHLAQAKRKREAKQNAYDELKLERKKDEFNRMPYAEQQAFMSAGGIDPNG